jgi:hypothetical protein
LWEAETRRRTAGARRSPVRDGGVLLVPTDPSRMTQRRVHGLDLTIGFELVAESAAAGLLAKSSLSASAIQALICDNVH